MYIHMYMWAYIGCLACSGIHHPKSVRISDIDQCIDGLFARTSQNHLVNIADTCAGMGVPDVVHGSLSVSSRYIYLSVFLKKSKYFSPMGRLVVIYNKQLGYLDCPCLKLKKCVNKMSSLHPIQMPHLVVNNPTDDVSEISMPTGTGAVCSDSDMVICQKIC